MDVIHLDKQALDIARKHLLENVSFRELSRRYYVSPSTIHRRLAKWLNENRFDLLDRAESGTAIAGAVDEGLGEALARKTGIWRARAVRVEGVDAAFTDQYREKPQSAAAQSAYKASDNLHKCLGETAAELIFGSLRKNMTIGLSSGRGVGFAIEKMGEIAKRTPSWASGYQNIQAISLCGGAHIGLWELTNTRDFDADENIFALAATLKIARNNVRYVIGPVAQAPSSPAKGGRIPELDLAVIGLGQLDTQHHYLRDQNEMQLKAMAGPVRRIAAWQEEHPQTPEAVAEIVLRLYPVGKDLPREFLDILDETNKTIVALPEEKIKTAGEVILIAGGKQKLKALAGLLYGRCAGAPIEKTNLTLVTDAWTAEQILHLA